MKINVKTLSLCLGLASLAFGQTTTAPIYNMSIVAGIPTTNSLGDNGPSQFAIVGSPQGLAFDASGSNLYISDVTNGRIRKINIATGIISTVTTSNQSTPSQMAWDPAGNLWVAEWGSERAVKINVSATSPSATIMAGNNVTNTYGGDGQYAQNAFFNNMPGIAIDAAGNVYLADYGNNRVRMIKNVNNCINTPVTSGPNQVNHTCNVYTIAGSSITPVAQVPVSSSGTAGAVSGPSGSATTLTASNQSVSGNNTVGDGGSAVQARLNNPWGVAVTPDGSMLYVSDMNDNRIRVINMQTGIINTVIGNCFNNNTAVTCAANKFGDPATNATQLGDGRSASQGGTNAPRGLYLDSAANILYFADSGTNNSTNSPRIRSINLNTGIVSTLVGGGSTTGDTGSKTGSGTLNNVQLNAPYDVRVQNGLIYWVEQGSNRVRVADPVAQTVTTLVAQPKTTGTNAPALQAYLGFPITLSSTSSPRVAIDPSDNLYIVEPSTHQIRKLNADGTLGAWAGVGSSGAPVAGSLPAATARLNNPQQLAFDSKGNGYIADTGNNVIRMVDTSGNITTVVGRAQITSCSSATVTAGQCVIDPSKYVGDGGAATNAVLNGPQGVAIDSAGNIIIADSGNNAIRMVNPATGVINTIAGGVPAGIAGGPTNGRSGLGSSGYQDSTNALYALFNNPRGVAVDKLGNIYVADYGNSASRELVPTGQGGYACYTYYGSASSSGTSPAIPTGTGQPTAPAAIRMSNNNTTSIAVDAGNNIYLAQAADNKVNVVSADHNKVYTVAGGGSNDSGPTITGTSLQTQTPTVTGVAVDSKGTVYTADRTGVVRKLVCTTNCLPLK
jgi:DNA-binding beta-propeller fold protein YncE